MIGIFIWTMIFLFAGVFIGYTIGSYLEMEKHEKNEKILRGEAMVKAIHTKNKSLR